MAKHRTEGRQSRRDFNGFWMGGAKPEERIGDLVFAPTRWQQIQWREMEGRIGGEDADRMVSSLAERPNGPKLPREVFSRLYGDPQRLPQDDVLPENRWAEAAHAALDDLPEFRQLREQCRGDADWSGMATVHLTNAAVSSLPEPSDEERRVSEARKRVAGIEGLAGDDGQLPEGLSQALDDAREELTGALADLAKLPVPSESDLRQKLRTAAKAAAEEIQEAEDAERSLSGGNGYGTGGSGATQKGNGASKLALAQKLRSNADLKRILKAAGRLRRIHAEKRAVRAHHARDELADVEIGSDLARVLPSEIGLLQNAYSRPLFYQRFMESQLMQYRLRGTERKAKGPIVTCVDESGSMGGDRNIWAKAVALAMLSAADQDRRGWGLVSFNTKVTGDMYAPTGTKRDSAELLEALSAFAGGGTEWQCALDRARKHIDDDKGLPEADIILITDGLCGTNERWLREFKAWKEDRGVTLYTVLIGVGKSQHDGLLGLSDEIIYMNGSDEAFVDQALGRI